MLYTAQSEQDRTLGVVGVEPARCIWTLIVNEPRRGHNDPGSTLLDPLHVSYMASGYAALQAADIVGLRRQRFRAGCQNRQREVVIAAAWRIALGNIKGPFAGTIERG